MTQRPRLIWVAVALGVSVLVGACVTLTSPKASKVDRGVRVNHAFHAEQGLDCATCHTAEEGRFTFPTHDLCSTCHDINVDEPSKEACGLCHTNEEYDVADYVKPLKGDVKFSHDPHVAKIEDCKTCHADPDKGTVSAGPQKPACMECHGKTDRKLNECSVCHNEITKETRPMHRAGVRIPHDDPATWKRVHGSESKVDPKYCALCHTEQSYCDTCHTTTAPDSHTLAWRKKTHGIEAGWNRNSCAVCHEESTCTKCHHTTEPESHRASWGAPINNHCTSCHYPPSKTGCTVCHESVEHKSAMPSPHRVLLYPPNCRKCHPGGSPMRAPHPTNSSVRCQFCH